MDAGAAERLTAPQTRMPMLGRLDALRVAATIRDPIGTMSWIYERYGPLAALQTGATFSKRPQRFVLAVGPRYNERVLGDPDTFHTSGLLAPGPEHSAQRRIRAGIVAMNGAQHAHYRRLTMPPLRRAAVDGMIGGMVEVMDRRIRSWPKAGEAVDLWPLVKDLARQVAVATLFTADKADEIPESLALADLITAHLAAASSQWVRLCPFQLPGLPYEKLIRHAERVEQSASAWARRRRGEVNIDDLMSIVVNSPTENGDMPDDGQIASQVMTLFGASYETCQAALLWTLFLLAQHPGVAAPLLDETSRLRGDDAFSADDLEKCGALDAVVKESLRLLPPVPYQARKAVRDTDLFDHEIAKRTRVILSGFLTNRFPGLYPEPDRFLPERWRNLNPSQYEFMDFSAGPRTCTGWWFAMTFLKVAVARIMRSVRWTIVPGCRVDRRLSITMAPRLGLPVTIHAQDGAFRNSAITGDLASMVRY